MSFWSLSNCHRANAIKHIAKMEREDGKALILGLAVLKCPIEAKGKWQPHTPLVIDVQLDF